MALDDVEPGSDHPDRRVDLLALDRGLDRLATLDRRQAQAVEMRMFAGMRVEETVAALNVSPRTIKADWRMAC